MSIVKGAIIFLAGVGLGAGGMYLYDHHEYEKRLAQDKADLAEAKEHYYNKIKKAKDKEKAEEIIKNEGYTTYNKSEVILDRVKNVIVEDHPREDYPSEPIVISEVEFAETETYFDKITADYYLDDGALVDENEEMLVVEDAIGFVNLEEFLNDDQQDVIYIRNGRISTDYMVRKVSGKYGDILGLEEDEDDE